MPHPIIIEVNYIQDEFRLIMISKTMLPFSEYVFLVDNAIESRVLQSLVISARQQGFDYFLATNADDEDVSKLLIHCIQKHCLTLKSLEPIKHVLQKTG